MLIKNIVETELEKIGIPENAIEEIKKFHGGVYGMVPREVWDMRCPPILREGSDMERKLCSMDNANSFDENVRNMIRKDNWKLHNEHFSMGREFMEFFSIIIKIDARNIGRDLFFLQLGKPWRKVAYVLKKELPKRKGEIVPRYRSTGGEGFRKSFNNGIVTITKESSSKSPVVAKGKLHEFTTLYYSHTYRIARSHSNNDD